MRILVQNFIVVLKKVMQSLIEWMILTPNCTRAACMHVDQKKRHRIFLKCNNQQAAFSFWYIAIIA